MYTVFNTFLHLVVKVGTHLVSVLSSTEGMWLMLHFLSSRTVHLLSKKVSCTTACTVSRVVVQGGDGDFDPSRETQRSRKIKNET